MIHQLVVENHGEVDYVAEPEALEYFEGKSMTGEDYELVSSASSESEDDAWE